MPQFDWSEDKLSDSLERVFEQAIDHANNSAQWYARNLRSKKRMAQLLRVLAIFAAAVAGLVPLLAHLYPDIPALWSTLALAVGATCIALDKFFGFSSGWMRYIRAQVALAALQEKFTFDWQIGFASWQGQPPTNEQTQAQLELAKVFVAAVNDIVETETQNWIAEFSNVLKQSEQGLRKK